MADELRLQALVALDHVRQLDGDLIGVLDHVIVREDVAGLAVDDEAAAGALFELRTAAAPAPALALARRAEAEQLAEILCLRDALAGRR